MKILSYNSRQIGFVRACFWSMIILVLIHDIVVEGFAFTFEFMYIRNQNEQAVIRSRMDFDLILCVVCMVRTWRHGTWVWYEQVNQMSFGGSARLLKARFGRWWLNSPRRRGHIPFKFIANNNERSQAKPTRQSVF